MKMLRPVVWLLALVALAAAACAADPTGTWKWATPSPTGDIETTLKLDARDGKLSGAYSNQFGDTAISNASLQGDAVAFDVVRVIGGSNYVVKYHGKLEGDTIKGTLEAPGRNGGQALKVDWTAKRSVGAVQSTAVAPPPGLGAIRMEDLKADLRVMAGAHFKGRSAGTIDEFRAAAWIAEQYRSIGLAPGGEDGTYFQFFDMWHNQLSERSTIELNGAPLAIGSDAAVAQPAHVALNAPIVYLGNAAEVDLGTVDVAGKIVALEANNTGINLNVSLPSWRYSRYIYNKYGLPLVTRGAIAIVFVADETAEQAWGDAAENFKVGTFDLEGGPSATVTARAPVIWLHAKAKAALQAGATLKANLIVSRASYPSANIIGVVPGTDPRLKSEYVLFSGHTDAHGIRNPIKGDNIYYGADDNGSVNVALLASARAFVQHPGRRSALFVIHGAEERGLLGSRHFSAHPTVPAESIVAVLNGDMIGRNAPGQAALLGRFPPHRNSADLVAMALAANDEGPKFTLDAGWDDAKHVEGWYFRSDHLPYARLGIPAIMYSTLLHPDYHTPQDSAENIDYPKLTQMTEWIYRTAWKVANAEQRPAADPDFKLER